MNQTQPDVPRKYAWPRYLVAAVILFILLAILWMSREVARVDRIRKDTDAQTNFQAVP